MTIGPLGSTQPPLEQPRTLADLLESLGPGRHTFGNFDTPVTSVVVQLSPKPAI